MVKIEKIDPNTQITVLREGQRRRVLLHQLITKQELLTAEVEGSGTVLVSIDEQEIKQLSSQSAVNETVKSEPTTSVLETAKPKLSTKEKVRALKQQLEQQQQ